MAMNLLKDIRTWKGSQQHAFEELITQLAMKDVPASGDFYATHGAGGDGGVECYCIFDDGSEWAWQAKHLPNLSQSSLKQIGKSVMAALSNHPRLTKYVVALPVNRTPKRKGTKKSEIDKWDERVAEWRRVARRKRITLNFEYWGETEILSKLAMPENEGMRSFWFSELEFTPRWFDAHFRRMRSIAGTRYTPKLSVKLDIAKSFDGLARTSRFFETMKSHAVALSKTHQYFKWAMGRLQLEKDSEDKCGEVATRVEFVIKILKRTNYPPTTMIPFVQVIGECDEIRQLVEKIDSSITDKTVIKKQEPMSSTIEGAHGDCYRLISDLEEIRDFASSKPAQLANEPCLLLTGDWGTGKTHLFCDVAESRWSKGLFSFVLFGQELTGTSITPKDWIANGLEVKAETIDTLFGAMDSLGRTSGGRVILFIDALNEGRGIDYWKSHLNALRTKLNDFPFVALSLSVRSSYADLIKPDAFDAVEEEHVGFGRATFEATSIYFDAYHLQLPSVPLLSPEFSRPMFLKLFCEGMRKAKRTIPRDGIHGITEVFEIYLECIAKELNDRYKLDAHADYVGRAVLSLANEMTIRQAEYLPYMHAKLLVDQLIHGLNDRESLFAGLISEGVLAKNRVKGNDVVYFVYNRFTDFLKAKSLIEGGQGIDDPASLFSEEGSLRWLLDTRNRHRNIGVLEALSVLFPEKFGCELIDHFPNEGGSIDLLSSFLQSLIWRKKDAFTETTPKYLNRILNSRDAWWREKALDAIVTLATIPNHAFDANRLHGYLASMKMPDRDLFWSLFLHHQEEREESIDRLISWGLRLRDTTQFDDAAVLSAGTVLVWCFTTSNRVVRDGATKAAICLLRHRLDIVIKLLERFETIDDLYVRERLYCVAYGCIMLSENNENITRIARFMYDSQFKDGRPIPHLLLREYAHGVIEFARNKGVDLSGIEERFITPPYHSEKLTAIPPPEIWTLRDKGYETISASVGDMGDFARYILGSNNSDVFLDRDIEIESVQRWIYQRVIDLGWDPAKFRDVDRHEFREAYSRHDHKHERIGKKYQWIAFHEIAARVLDNCSLVTNRTSFDEEYQNYWQLSRRDIDPSNIFPAAEPEEPISGYWSTPYSFPLSVEAQWLRESSNIPNPIEMLLVTNPNDDTQYLNLEMLWGADQDTEDIGTSAGRNSIWYSIRSFFVHKRDLRSIVGSLKRRPIRGTAIPSVVSNSSCYLGEHFWGGANQYKTGWINDTDPWSKLPGPMVSTASHYSSELSHDYSPAHSSSALMPSSWFASEAGLGWSRDGYAFEDASKKTVCFDASTMFRNGNSCLLRSPAALLVDRSFLDDFLKSHDLALVWIVSGEKMVYRAEKHPFGWQEIDGVYSYDGESVRGRIKTRHQKPRG